MSDLHQLKFPIGEFQKTALITPENLDEAIEVIEQFPEVLKKVVEHLSDIQLDTPYRPEGWTIRQVVHHCADSHMNSLIRFKWAITEDNPIIKAYYEERWAELADSKTLPIEPSLGLLIGLHARWTVLLNSLNEEALQRTFTHPATNETVSLKENILIYAWHCKHHLAHITSLKERMRWQ